jgi:hypothetical protein
VIRMSPPRRRKTCARPQEFKKRLHSKDGGALQISARQRSDSVHTFWESQREPTAWLHSSSLTPDSISVSKKSPRRMRIFVGLGNQCPVKSLSDLSGPEEQLPNQQRLQQAGPRPLQRLQAAPADTSP